MEVTKVNLWTIITLIHLPVSVVSDFSNTSTLKKWLLTVDRWLYSRQQQSNIWGCPVHVLFFPSEQTSKLLSNGFIVMKIYLYGQLSLFQFIFKIKIKIIYKQNSFLHIKCSKRKYKGILTKFQTNVTINIPAEWNPSRLTGRHLYRQKDVQDMWNAVSKK